MFDKVFFTALGANCFLWSFRLTCFKILMDDLDKCQVPGITIEMLFLLLVACLVPFRLIPVTEDMVQKIFDRFSRKC